MFSHHALYIEDSPLKVEAYIPRVREMAGFAPGDPGFITSIHEKFGIDEARKLQELAQLRKMGESAVFFVCASSMTSEAQQALLKLFEEPQEGVGFVLLVPQGTLLPTLKSRCLPYPEKIQSEASLAMAKEFLSSPYKARSEQISALLKNEEEWTRERVREMFEALERLLWAARERKGPEEREIREGLEDIEHFRKYLSDRSPSLKLILEHLAATLPQLSV